MSSLSGQGPQGLLASTGSNWRVRSRIAEWSEALHEPVSAQSLAAFRISFGLLMMWDVWRFIKYTRIQRYYVEPEFFFTFYGFNWVRPLADPFLMHAAWLLVGVLAFMVVLGLFYRFAIVGFTALFTYFFLLDKAQYLNHFYMIILFAGLLCLLPANRAYALDAWLFPRRRSETVPRYSVWALRTQMEIILIYAGLVKISEDWLKLEPLGMWLRVYADTLPLGHLLYSDWVIGLGAYGTVLLHVLGAPLLLFKRTRLPVFVVYCCFHMSNAFFFNIGIFPWMTIAASTIFFAPNWPEQFLRWLLRPFGSAPVPTQNAAQPANGRTVMSSWLIVFLVAWMVVQLLIPLRSMLYSSEVRWAGEGHRFSWRMRIYDRRKRGHFEVVGAHDGQRWEVKPTAFLSRRQARSMLGRPDMIVQFSHYLEDVWAERGYGDVAVYAHVEMALNGREFQQLIKPDIDLTNRITSPWQTADYVTALTTPFTPWAERQHADYDGPTW